MSVIEAPMVVSVRTGPTPADRVFVGLLYRAMRMIAAAVRERYGITILVEMERV